MHEVQRRDPCDDSLLTLGSLGIGKKTPAGAKVWEYAQPRAKVLLKGRYYPFEANGLERNSQQKSKDKNLCTFNEAAVGEILLPWHSEHGLLDV